MRALGTNNQYRDREGATNSIDVSSAETALPTGRSTDLNQTRSQILLQPLVKTQ